MSLPLVGPDWCPIGFPHLARSPHPVVLHPVAPRPVAPRPIAPRPIAHRPVVPRPVALHLPQ